MSADPKSIHEFVVALTEYQASMGESDPAGPEKMPAGLEEKAERVYRALVEVIEDPTP